MNLLHARRAERMVGMTVATTISTAKRHLSRVEETLANNDYSQAQAEIEAASKLIDELRNVTRRSGAAG
jgi:uncharacterized Zn finger protein